MEGLRLARGRRSVEQRRRKSKGEWGAVSSLVFFNIKGESEGSLWPVVGEKKKPKGEGLLFGVRWRRKNPNVGGGGWPAAWFLFL